MFLIRFPPRSAAWYFRLVFAFLSMRNSHAVRSALVSTSSLAARQIYVCPIFPQRQRIRVNYLFANLRGLPRLQSRLSTDEAS